jgi:hypothetical protein
MYLRSTNGQVWGRPVNGVDAKYLLSGLAECGRCGGTLEVRSRSHGRRRAYFYMCSTHRRRGPKICRGLDMPMPLADEAILSTFEKMIIDPETLQRACARVFDDDAHTVQTAAQKAELLKRQGTLVEELQRLTDALAAGGDSRSLRAGITLREAEAARIDRELARMARGTATRSAGAASQLLEELLPEWRAVLRKHAPEARQMLRKLLNGRVVVTPEERHEQPGYRVRGVATVEPLLNVVLRSDVAQSAVFPVAGTGLGDAKTLAISGSAQAVASPTGFAVMYSEDSIRIELAGHAKERVLVA